MSDVNPKVRRAAFRLTERLNDKQVLELLVDFARHEDIGVAKGAIRSLANLQSAHAVGALVSTLEVTKEHERAIACAQALAQLGDPVAVPALEDVLTARKFLIWGGNVGTIKFEPRRRLRCLRLAASVPKARFAKLWTIPTLVFARSPRPPPTEDRAKCGKRARTSRRRKLTAKTRARASRSGSTLRGSRPRFDLTAVMIVVLDQVGHGAADRARFVSMPDTEVALPGPVFDIS